MAPIKIGDPVYIKAERDKFKFRDHHLVMQIDEQQGILQKINGSKRSSRRYSLPLSQVHLVLPLNRNPLPFTSR